MTIKRNTDLGKKLVDTLGDGSRVVVSTANLEATMAKLSAVVGSTIPVLYAGGSPEAVVNAGTDNVIVGLVAQQRKEDGAKQAETFYTAILVTPLFSIESLIGDDAGKAWVAKIIEKESAHVSFRPIRNAEEGESLEAYAERVPVTLSDLVTAAARDKIDTEAVSLLWPLLRLSIQEAAKNGDAVARGTLGFLPGAKAIPTVSKALRSADWAKRNTPELEKASFWGIAGKVMLELAKSPVPTGEADETTMVDASIIGQWLESRDETVIEAPIARAPKDVAALEAFVAGMANVGNAS